jgi:hypothetical protein
MIGGGMGSQININIGVITEIGFYNANSRVVGIEIVSMDTKSMQIEL